MSEHDARCERETWPRVTDDGRTVWACCVSSIGPTCQHLAREEVTP